MRPFITHKVQSFGLMGGKHGLLNTLIEIWTTAPIVAATIGSIEAMDDPVAIIRLVAAVCRSMREEFGDIIRVTLTTAPHDNAVSDSLRAATAKYRQGVRTDCPTPCGSGCPT